MSNPPQVIRPPNPLRAKVGGFGGIDADAIASRMLDLDQQLAG